MNRWIDCYGRMPDTVRPDDEVVVKFRNGNEHRRRADECDWDQIPSLPGDIVMCRLVDPIDIIKEEIGPTTFPPLEARNVYMVGPLALYVHDAPEKEIRGALREVLKCLEVFISSKERTHATPT